MFARDPRRPEPGRWVWVLGGIVCWLVVPLGLWSCQPKPAVELLQVSAVMPNELSFGDAFQVIGDGFALGSAASVVFSGSVHRAGQPDRAVNLSLEAETESQRELVLVLPHAAQADLAGEAGSASHATFRGDVQVAIAAKLRGAPPVTGTLHGAVLELYPASQTRAAEERLKLDGQRILAFIGVEAVLADDGLTLVRVAPGSRAAAADLRPGDRILRAAGVSVLMPSDLVPLPGRTQDLMVARGASERALSVDVDGFAPRPPRSVDVGAVAVAAAALGFVLCASPLARLGGWIAHSWIEERRARLALALARGRAPRPGPRRARKRSWLDLVSDGVGVLVWLGIGAALLSPALRSAPIDLSLGLLALCFAASTLMAAAALVRGGRQPGRWSLALGIRAAFRQCLVVAPGWVALVSICGDAGVDFDALVAAQGPLPWTWNAFSNPGLSLLFLLLLSTALPRASLPHFRLVRASAPVSFGRSRADDFVGWLYLCSTCAVASSAFLGADAWSGMALDSTHDASAASLPAALALLVKYTTLVLLLLFLRRVCSSITSEEWAPIALRICLPLSLLGVGLAHAFRSLRGFSPFAEWITAGFGPASVALLTFGVSAFVWRVLGASDRAPQASLTPWS